MEREFRRCERMRPNSNSVNNNVQMEFFGKRKWTAAGGTTYVTPYPLMIFRIGRIGSKLECQKTENKMNKGFTLIETMIALVLVTMAMLFMAAALSHSHSQYRLSFKRFAVIQRLENLKNQLLSLSFDSAESAIGVHSVREERMRIVWVVSASSPALKRIEGTVFDPLTKRTLVFFKSKFLLEVNDD